jgi:hypothetical protein
MLTDGAVNDFKALGGQCLLFCLSSASSFLRKYTSASNSLIRASALRNALAFYDQ